MKQQKDGSGKIYRTKSSNLPLETIPPGTMTLRLVVTSPAFRNIESVESYVRELTSSDEYITRGRVGSEDLSNNAIDHEWQNTLREIVKAKYRYNAPGGRVLIPHLKIAMSKIAREELSSI